MQTKSNTFAFAVLGGLTHAARLTNKVSSREGRINITDLAQLKTNTESTMRIFDVNTALAQKDFDAPENVQQLLTDYAGNLETTDSQCGFIEAMPTDSDAGQLSGIRVSCPVIANRVAKVQYTDSPENWARTVDHCDNVLLQESTQFGTGLVTRTYATWGPVEVNTVAFWRPAGSEAPNAHGIALFSSGFEVPDETRAPGCGLDNTLPDHSENDDAANANAQMAETYM